MSSAEASAPRERDELLQLRPAAHGGDAPPGALDFSTGVSPLPLPEAVLEAIRTADLTRYPHPTALPLRAAAARFHGEDPEAIAAGNGSTEILWALARAFGGPGRTVLAPSPAFAEYAQAARASGSRLVELARQDLGFDGLAAAAREAGASLVFLARPSTPLLDVVPAEAILGLARELPGTLVAVDEAYQPLCDDLPPLRPARNLAIVRSLTKALALPGLRAGYLLADPAVARAVRASLPPWNVSAPAAAAAAAALDHPHLFREARQGVRALREDLAQRLRAVDARIEAAGGPFVVCDVGRAEAFAASLLRRGLRVRDCTSFGLPRLVRVGVRGPDAHARLAAAWPRAEEESR